MTNVLHIFTALVMLLQINNLSVSGDIEGADYAVLESDTIPKWKVWLLGGMDFTLLPFQHFVHPVFTLHHIIHLLFLICSLASDI